MPQCPGCFAEMEYDAMMRHDAQVCRAATRELVEAALAVEASCGANRLPADTFESQAAWTRFREALRDFKAMRAAAEA